MKAVIKSCAFIFAFVLLVAAAVFTAKSINNKPSHFFGISNGIEPETKYKDTIVYIRDTTPTIGRDQNNVQGNQNVTNSK